jgi:hypothetical protein
MVNDASLVVVFPWLREVKVPVPVEGGGRLFTATSADLGDLDFTIRPVDLPNLFGASWAELKYENLRWTALEIPDENVPQLCYAGLTDLLTDTWEYELEWRAASRDEHPKRNRQEVNDTFVARFNAGLRLLFANRRFQIAMIRWSRCFKRSDPLDTVLDCCSCLEASFQMGEELRLRTALAVYFALDEEPELGFRTAYNMYGIRSKFIHGSKIPDVTEEERRKYVKLVATLLDRFIEVGAMPNRNDLDAKILRKFGGETE